MNPTLGLGALLRASLESAVLLGLIWALTRAWPRMPAAARCALWWLGALRAIVGLLPVPAIPVAFHPSRVPLPRPLPTPVLELGNAMAGVAGTQAAAPVHAAPAALNVVPLVVLGIWIAGVVVGAALMARRIAAIRRAWREAVPFADPRVARWRDEWAVVLGRSRVPEVRASAEAAVPVAIGVFRTGLLLPADSARLSDDALRVVLAHEMSHVRRRDPLLAWVPAGAQLLFWFHPLVRLAAREYLAAREQVCDADALRATQVSPRDYGNLLLDYGVGRMSEVPGLASCGSRGSRDLKRRIEMLSRTLRIPFGHRVGAMAVTLAVVVLAFMPIRLVAAHESDDATKSEEKAKRAYQLDKERMELKKKEYLEMKRAYPGSKSDAWKQKASDRTPVAYAIKIQDKKGTRGSIDELDMDAMRRLDYENESVVYFRLGEDMWVSDDPEVMADVKRALEPEDRLAEREGGRDDQVSMLEEARAKIELQRAEMERRATELEARKAYMAEREKSRRETGRSMDDLRAERDEMEHQDQMLWEAKEKLRHAEQMLSEQMKSSYARRKVSYAERDELHQQVLEHIAEIANRAIEQGTARRFEP